MRFREFLSAPVIIEEAARIQHAEDLIFWEGSNGALRALEALEGMTSSNYKKTSVKWDGSVAVIFGYDNDGNFTLTDKSGFYAKGYNGRPNSPEELREMFLNRSGGKNRENPDYVAFANRMAEAFYVFKSSLPSNYKGYFKADVLYFSTPPVKNGYYVFKPNVVQYEVDANSQIGKRIGQSSVGVVVHRSIDENGQEHPLKDFNVFKGKELFVIPPVFVEQKATIDESLVKQTRQLIRQNHLAVDSMLDESTLRQKQIADFPGILYKYVNNKVDSGLENLGQDFFEWLGNEKLSTRKKTNITEHVNENKEAFRVLWQIVTNIMSIKDDIIYQFDNNVSVVKQSMAGESGGEGYVYADKNGDIKLVPRSTFSRINRSIER